MRNFIIAGFIVAVAIAATGCGMEQVDEGFRGIKTNWGKVVDEPLKPGLYFYNPISSGIFEMDVRERKMEETTEVFTRDTQHVAVTYSITYFPKTEKIGELYSQFGRDWDEKIVKQVVLGGLKDAVGKYTADDLVSKREECKQAAEREVSTALADRSVTVTRLDFINLDFDDAYEAAVKAKVVAIQRSAEAKNKTVQVEEEAKQKITAAKADAEAMRIKSQALSQNKGLVQYEAVQKWNGNVPQIVMGGNSIPFLNMSDLMKGSKE